MNLHMILHFNENLLTNNINLTIFFYLINFMVYQFILPHFIHFNEHMFSKIII